MTAWDASWDASAIIVMGVVTPDSVTAPNNVTSSDNVHVTLIFFR